MTKLTPYGWQNRDLRTLRQDNYTGLLAIEAGGGKSLTATMAIRDSGAERVLILAPKSTLGTAWTHTLRDNADVDPRIMGRGNKTEKAALLDYELGYPGVYLATHQFMTRSDVSAWDGDLLILDESHSLSTYNAKGQTKLSGATPRQAQEALNSRFAARLALSGTPMRQAFENLWATVRFLWPEYSEAGEIGDQNFYRWQMERMTYETVYTNQRDQWGNAKAVKQFLTEKDPGRLISEMPCVIMHKRRERCCEDHPNGFLPTEEPQVIEREVILTAGQKRNIRDMETQMVAYLGENPLVATIPLTQKQRVRQLAMAEADVEYYDGEDASGEPVVKSRVVFPEGAKSPVIDEILHILGNLPEDENVVIYSESRRFAKLITDSLDDAHIPAAEYSGVTKADLNMFGTEYRALVGVVSAIGTGTDGLQAKCSTEIWADQPVSLTTQAQTQARLDRMGGNQVQRYVLLDDQGVQAGRVEDLVMKKAMVARSLTR